MGRLVHWWIGRLVDWKDGRVEGLYNHIWNMRGAFIHSLKDKTLDGSWDRANKVIEEEPELYDV